MYVSAGYYTCFELAVQLLLLLLLLLNHTSYEYIPGTSFCSEVLVSHASSPNGAGSKLLLVARCCGESVNNVIMFDSFRLISSNRV